MIVIATAEAARARAERIRRGLAAIVPEIRAAWTEKDWLALEYESYDAYMLGEFGGPVRLGREERGEAVVELRSAGMSTRAIGSALGVGTMTVSRELSGVPNGTGDSVTGLDGKSYPASRPVVMIDVDRRPIPETYYRLTKALRAVEELRAEVVKDGGVFLHDVPDRERDRLVQLSKKVERMLAIVTVPVLRLN